MLKSGIDYFPLDVDLDTKIQLIEAEFGLKGFAVVVKLFQMIYGKQGYYCEWNEEIALLFGSQTGMGGNAVSEIVSASIRRGIFDKTLYEKYGILSSKGIQKRYWEAAKRRISVEFREEYLLFDDVKNQKNVNILRKNVCRNQKNVCRNYQSREEKSKVEKSRVEESIEAAPSPSPKQHFGEFENVLLTDEEFQKLVGRFTAQGAAERIERLSTYLASSGKRYKSHYATILNWAQKDGASERKPEPKSLASKKAIFARIAEEERNAINES